MKWLIIDEVSLVSNKLFNFINWRLQDIKYNHDVPFGGVNIICCGDLSQLPPISGGWIFQDMTENKNYDGSLSPPTKKRKKCTEMEKAIYNFSTNLWKSNMKSYELTEIMRTENRKFAEVLHSLRNLRHVKDNNGKFTKTLEPMKPEDIEFLNKTCSASKLDSDYDPTALHIYYKNAQVNEQNQKTLEIFERNGTVLEDITANDNFVDNTFVSEGTKMNILRGLKIKRHTETQQLHYHLRIGINCRVSLTTNISIDDGLVNGAMGTVKYLTKTASGKIHIIWVEFDDKKIGSSSFPVASNYA